MQTKLPSVFEKLWRISRRHWNPMTHPECPKSLLSMGRVETLHPIIRRLQTRDRPFLLRDPFPTWPRTSHIPISRDLLQVCRLMVLLLVLSPRFLPYTELLIFIHPHRRVLRPRPPTLGDHIFRIRFPTRLPDILKWQCQHVLPPLLLQVRGVLQARQDRFLQMLLIILDIIDSQVLI
ncbi:hypothetical protein GYMLUDRAFT_726213 [Collybiopsis luxurians FD-317 M1]|nr:hypothetical protein GYMLUDRAFT_726213 [Collybiopsis luxurians FD-317 M1]